MNWTLIGILLTLFFGFIGIIGIIITLIIYRLQKHKKSHLIENKVEKTGDQLQVVQAGTIEKMIFNPPKKGKRKGKKRPKENTIIKNNNGKLNNIQTINKLIIPLESNPINKSIGKEEKKEIENIILFQDNIKVIKHTHYKLYYYLHKGNILKGEIREINNKKLEIYLVNGKNYSYYANEEEFNIIEEYLDSKIANIYVKIPRNDYYYIIFDAINKQNDRILKIFLEKIIIRGDNDDKKI